MPIPLFDALRLREEGFPQERTALVWVCRRGDGLELRWFLEYRPDREATLEAHTLGALLLNGVAVDWCAAPEASDAEAFGRGCTRLDLPSEG